jgi:hypothetical protein
MSSLHPDIRRVLELGWRLHPSSQYSRASCVRDAATVATTNIDQIKTWATPLWVRSRHRSDPGHARRYVHHE